MRLVSTLFYLFLFGIIWCQHIVTAATIPVTKVVIVNQPDDYIISPFYYELLTFNFTLQASIMTAMKVSIAPSALSKSYVTQVSADGYNHVFTVESSDFFSGHEQPFTFVVQANNDVVIFLPAYQFYPVGRQNDVMLSPSALSTVSSSTYGFMTSVAAECRNSLLFNYARSFANPFHRLVLGSPRLDNYNYVVDYNQTDILVGIAYAGASVSPYVMSSLYDTPITYSSSKNCFQIATSPLSMLYEQRILKVPVYIGLLYSQYDFGSVGLSYTYASSRVFVPYPKRIVGEEIYFIKFEKQKVDPALKFDFTTFSLVATPNLDSNDSITTPNVVISPDLQVNNIFPQWNTNFGSMGPSYGFGVKVEATNFNCSLFSYVAYYIDQTILIYKDKEIGIHCSGQYAKRVTFPLELALGPTSIITAEIVSHDGSKYQFSMQLSMTWKSGVPIYTATTLMPTTPTSHRSLIKYQSGASMVGIVPNTKMNMYLRTVLGGNEKTFGVAQSPSRYPFQYLGATYQGYIDLSYRYIHDYAASNVTILIADSYGFLDQSPDDSPHNISTDVINPIFKFKAVYEDVNSGGEVSYFLVTVKDQSGIGEASPSTVVMSGQTFKFTSANRIRGDAKDGEYYFPFTYKRVECVPPHVSLQDIRSNLISVNATSPGGNIIFDVPSTCPNHHRVRPLHIDYQLQANNSVVFTVTLLSANFASNSITAVALFIYTDKENTSPYISVPLTYDYSTYSLYTYTKQYQFAPVTSSTTYYFGLFLAINGTIQPTLSTSDLLYYTTPSYSSSASKVASSELSINIKPIGYVPWILYVADGGSNIFKVGITTSWSNMKNMTVALLYPSSPYPTRSVWYQGNATVGNEIQLPIIVGLCGQHYNVYVEQACDNTNYCESYPMFSLYKIFNYNLKCDLEYDYTQNVIVGGTFNQTSLDVSSEFRSVLYTFKLKVDNASVVLNTFENPPIVYLTEYESNDQISFVSRIKSTTPAPIYEAILNIPLNWGLRGYNLGVWRIVDALGGVFGTDTPANPQPLNLFSLSYNLKRPNIWKYVLSKRGDSILLSGSGFGYERDNITVNGKLAKFQFTKSDTQGVISLVGLNIPVGTQLNVTFGSVYSFIIGGNASPVCPNNCSGHGQCLTGNMCVCDLGWGLMDCSKYLVYQCPNNCTSHGQCIDSICSCSSNYTGSDCSTLVDTHSTYNVTVSPGDPTSTFTGFQNNNNTGTTPTDPTKLVNDKSKETTFTIKLIAIEEFDFTGELLRVHSLGNWQLQERNETYAYYLLPLANNTGNVTVSVYTFAEASEISNTLHRSSHTSSYHHSAQFNLVWSSEAIPGVPICSTYDNIDVGGEQSDAHYIKVGANQLSLYGRFSDQILVDGKKTVTNNIVSYSDTNKTTIFIRTAIPHFNNLVDVDPDFSVLIDYDQDTSDCGETKTKEKFETWKIAVIVAVVGAAILVVAAITIIKKNMYIRTKISQLRRSKNIKLITKVVFVNQPDDYIISPFYYELLTFNLTLDTSVTIPMTVSITPSSVQRSYTTQASADGFTHSFVVPSNDFFTGTEQPYTFIVQATNYDIVFNPLYQFYPVGRQNDVMLSPSALSTVSSSTYGFMTSAAPEGRNSLLINYARSFANPYHRLVLGDARLDNYNYVVDYNQTDILLGIAYALAGGSISPYIMSGLYDTPIYYSNVLNCFQITTSPLNMLYEQRVLNVPVVGLSYTYASSQVFVPYPKRIVGEEIYFIKFEKQKVDPALKFDFMTFTLSATPNLDSNGTITGNWIFMQTTDLNEYNIFPQWNTNFGSIGPSYGYTISAEVQNFDCSMYSYASYFVDQTILIYKDKEMAIHCGRNYIKRVSFPLDLVLGSKVNINIIFVTRDGESHQNPRSFTMTWKSGVPSYTVISLMPTTPTSYRTLIKYQSGVSMVGIIPNTKMNMNIRTVLGGNEKTFGVAQSPSRYPFQYLGATYQGYIDLSYRYIHDYAASEFKITIADTYSYFDQLQDNRPHNISTDVINPIFKFKAVCEDVNSGGEVSYFLVTVKDQSGIGEASPSTVVMSGQTFKFTSANRIRGDAKDGEYYFPFTYKRVECVPPHVSLQDIRSNLISVNATSPGGNIIFDVPSTCPNHHRVRPLHVDYKTQQANNNVLLTVTLLNPDFTYTTITLVTLLIYSDKENTNLIASVPLTLGYSTYSLFTYTKLYQFAPVSSSSTFYFGLFLNVNGTVQPTLSTSDLLYYTTPSYSSGPSKVASSELSINIKPSGFVPWILTADGGTNIFKVSISTNSWSNMKNMTVALLYPSSPYPTRSVWYQGNATVGPEVQFPVTFGLCGQHYIMYVEQACDNTNYCESYPMFSLYKMVGYTNKCDLEYDYTQRVVVSGTFNQSSLDVSSEFRSVLYTFTVQHENASVVLNTFENPPIVYLTEYESNDQISFVSRIKSTAPDLIYEATLNIPLNWGLRGYNLGVWRIVDALGGVFGTDTPTNPQPLNLFSLSYNAKRPNIWKYSLDPVTKQIKMEGSGFGYERDNIKINGQPASLLFTKSDTQFIIQSNVALPPLPFNVTFGSVYSFIIRSGGGGNVSPVCPNNCSSHGDCLAGNLCRCQLGWGLDDCSKYLVYQCPNNCTSHGQCIDSICSCNSNYTGSDCSTLVDTHSTYNVTVSPGDPTSTFTGFQNNNNTGTTPTDPTKLVNDKSKETTFTIKLIAIEEFDFTGELLRVHSLGNWQLQQKNETFSNYLLPLINDTGNVTVSVYTFAEASEIVWLNSTIKIPPRSVKYFASIKSYQFLSSLSTIQLVWSSEAIPGVPICSTYDNIDVGGEQSDAHYIKVGANQLSLYGRFSDQILVDGKKTVTNNIVSYSDTNKTTILIRTAIPHFNNLVDVDPDFSVLIDYDQDTSDCGETKTKENSFETWKIAVIVAVVGAAILVVLFITVIKKNIPSTYSSPSFLIFALILFESKNRAYAQNLPPDELDACYWLIRQYGLPTQQNEAAICADSERFTCHQGLDGYHVIRINAVTDEFINQGAPDAAIGSLALPNLNSFITDDDSVESIPNGFSLNMPVVRTIYLEDCDALESLGNFFNGSSAYQIFVSGENILGGVTIDQSSYYPSVAAIRVSINPTTPFTSSNSLVFTPKSFPVLADLTISSNGRITVNVTINIPTLVTLKLLALGSESPSFNPTIVNASKITYLLLPGSNFETIPNIVLPPTVYSYNLRDQQNSLKTVPWTIFSNLKNSVINLEDNSLLTGTVPDFICANRLRISNTLISKIPDCYWCYYQDPNIISTSLQKLGSFYCNITFEKNVGIVEGIGKIVGDNLGFGNNIDLIPVVGNKIIALNYPLLTTFNPLNLNVTLNQVMGYTIELTLYKADLVYSTTYSEISYSFSVAFDSVITNPNLVTNVYFINLDHFNITYTCTAYIDALSTLRCDSPSDLVYGNYYILARNSYNQVGMSAPVGDFGKITYPLVTSGSVHQSLQSDLPLIRLNGFFGAAGNKIEWVTVKLNNSNSIICTPTFRNSSTIDCTVQSTLPPGLITINLSVDNYTATLNNLIVILPPPSQSLQDQCQATTNNCNGNGQCTTFGICVCNQGYYDDCKFKLNPNVTFVPNITKPVASFDLDGYRFDFALVSVQELDIDDNVVQEVLVDQWNVTDLSDGAGLTSVHYKLLINSTLNPTLALVNVTTLIEHSLQDRQVPFGDSIVSIGPNSIKVGLNITGWQYTSVLSHLRVVFSTIVNTQQTTIESCSSDSVPTFQEVVGSDSYLRVIHNDTQFYGRFLSYSFSDGKRSYSRNQLVNQTTIPNRSNESLALIGINLNQCQQCLLDPDFFALIADRPAGNQQVDCSSPSSSSNTWKIIVGATIGGVVFIALVVASALYLRNSNSFRFRVSSIKKKILMKKLNNN
ncbi:hypothetical protein DFA_09208 [Cavenderia fasciculata]|uniref:EGF-like domain-containing protein n=1 Tax=Cavenderia fasciculata TaxID=261658 RepID=F4Q6Z8_CACFS|nr:uncharacterized protein DFA_09208 [Cavenderia fasciculata]EGG16180.1 hypothetical protein DFA_09208 [Cavenderia fasciculata]|eukprot:XP_004354564.1 hypothetical protein DFA_09208 [Cavenderia fasciculata]